MNRDFTNRVRYVMDEWLPAAIRDSRWFMYPFYRVAYSGQDLDRVMRFKSLVHTWTPREYTDFYTSLDSISRRRLTDLNAASLARVLSSVDAETESVLDVGAGKGLVTHKLRESHPRIRAVAVDVAATQPALAPGPYVQADVARLPFADGSFDVVVCNHTLEHVVDLDSSVRELLRVARTRVVITTPCQRPFYYTLDEHINFFPYREALTSRIGLRFYTCEYVHGDWVYVGHIEDHC